MTREDLESGNELQRQYRQLQRATAKERGAGLPGLVAEAFERAGFQARVDAHAATPRDTDIFLSYDDEFLAEIKWTSRRAGIAAVDELRSRLRRTAPYVVGLLISVAGFSAEAITAVQDDRSRLILLMDGKDIERLLALDESVVPALRLKKRALVRDATALVGGIAAPRLRPVRPNDLPDGIASLFDEAGQQVPWLGVDGSPGDLVFVDEFPDVDWTPAQGHGTGLDVRLPVAFAAAHRREDARGLRCPYLAHRYRPERHAP